MKRPRHSLKDQEVFVDRVYDRKEEGLSIRSAVREMGISLSSFYRWEELTKGKRSRSAIFGETRIPTVEKAIEVIVNYNMYDKIYRIISILRLSYWVLWPDEPESHEPAVVAGLICYFSRDKDIKYMSDLDRINLDEILKYIRIDVILNFYNWSMNIGPKFDHLRQHDRRYSDRDVVAEVVRYFIVAKLNSTKNHNYPNLTKAKDAIQAGFMNTSLEVSDRTFKKYWRRYSPSAPFVYVDNYETDLSWMLDPTSKSYCEYIDEIITRPEEAKLFLAKCKFVTEVMTVNLDRRALARITYPTFPESLIAEPVLPEKIEALQTD